MKRVFRKHLLQEDMKHMPAFVRMFMDFSDFIEDGSEVKYLKTDDTGCKVYESEEGLLVHEDWTEVIEDDILIEDMDFEEN